MREQEIVEEIERNRNMLLKRGGSLSHRRIALISQRIDSLRKELDNGRVFI